MIASASPTKVTAVRDTTFAFDCQRIADQSGFVSRKGAHPANKPGGVPAGARAHRNQVSGFSPAPIQRDLEVNLPGGGDHHRYDIIGATDEDFLRNRRAILEEVNVLGDSGFQVEFAADLLEGHRVRIIQVEPAKQLESAGILAVLQVFLKILIGSVEIPGGFQIPDRFQVRETVLRQAESAGPVPDRFLIDQDLLLGKLPPRHGAQMSIAHGIGGVPLRCRSIVPEHQIRGRQ